MTPSSPRKIREAWIDALNTHPATQALGLFFEDSPSIIEPDVAHGKTRGFVAYGEEQDTNGHVLEAQLVTTVVAAGRTDKDALDLVDDARDAILGAFLATESNAGFLGGLVGPARYVGSQPAMDGQGRRVYHARHYFIAVRVINPLRPV